MESEIQKKLKRIEYEESITVLYACEVGSRAFGYASEKSDHDVRFIYVHPLSWYLSIDEKRDVIEKPINDTLDLSGWELRKTLRMFRKSNPTLLEWLYSDTVYMVNKQFMQQLKALKPLFFSEKACLYHYLNMAKKNYKMWNEKKQDDKLFLHILRPLLMCERIMTTHTMPPLQVQKLSSFAPESIRANIHVLLEKRRAQEKDQDFLINPSLSIYVEEIMGRIESYLDILDADIKKPNEQLDQLFYNTLIRMNQSLKLQGGV